MVSFMEGNRGWGNWTRTNKQSREEDRESAFWSCSSNYKRDNNCCRKRNSKFMRNKSIIKETQRNLKHKSQNFRPNLKNFTPPIQTRNINSQKSKVSKNSHPPLPQSNKVDTPLQTAMKCLDICYYKHQQQRSI